jgi:hypothetical protein
LPSLLDELLDGRAEVLRRAADSADRGVVENVGEAVRAQEQAIALT